MPDLIASLLSTPAARRAVADVNNHRSRARQYFSCVMATGDVHQMVQAGHVVLALDGREPTLECLQWLSVLTGSFDAEAARMAKMALGVILDG